MLTADNKDNTADNPRSRTRPQPAIDHYGAVSTFHDDDICETRFSMLCTSCLELITEIIIIFYTPGSKDPRG